MTAMLAAGTAGTHAGAFRREWPGLLADLHAHPTPCQREVLLLLAEGMAIPDVSVILETTEAAVRSRYRRFLAGIGIMGTQTETWLAYHRRCCVWAIPHAA